MSGISKLAVVLVLVQAVAVTPAIADDAIPLRTPIAKRLQAHRVPLDGKKVAQGPAVKVTCDVIEISASTGKTASIDPDIKPLEKKLKKQPWTYNQYKLLSKSSKMLEKGKTESLSLKIGTGTAQLVETVDKSRARISVTEDHDGKRVVNHTTTIAAGDWLIVGHPASASNDGHLVAMRCK